MNRAPYLVIRDPGRKPPASVRALGSVEGDAPGRLPVEISFYRNYTEAMVRRYGVMSMEAGRVPALLGRELFRGKVTSYKVQSFEDSVIFCLDVEKCLGRLKLGEQMLIKRVALQQYTLSEAAGMLGLSLRDCVRRYPEAVDRLSLVFLEAGLMEPLKSCQEAEAVENGRSEAIARVVS